MGDLGNGGYRDVRRAIAHPDLIRAENLAEGIRVLELTDAME
jgi:hypothetical protein